MANQIKNLFSVLIWATAATITLTLMGIAYIWFINPTVTDLPFLKTLIGSVVLESIALALLYAKRGMKYLPTIRTNKTKADTVNFMIEFIGSGSSATIVSNRLSWVVEEPNTIEKLRELTEKNLRLEIITPQEPDPVLRDNLPNATFVVTGKKGAPEARFTLVNGDRAGSEKLAIARGIHPNHEITEFDTNSGPQMIAMAKDIISSSRESLHANSLE